jgi:excisionase family DNA binding protein
MQMQSSSSDSLSNLLSKAQAADRLNISLRTLDYKLKAGLLPHVRMGKLVRFIPSDIEKFIEAHKIGG